MSQQQNTIGAGEYKAKCLKIMDEVNNNHRVITITKRGKPIAKLVPIIENALDVFGCMQNTLKIKKDIISPIDTKWESNE